MGMHWSRYYEPFAGLDEFKFIAKLESVEYGTCENKYVSKIASEWFFYKSKGFTIFFNFYVPVQYKYS